MAQRRMFSLKVIDTDLFLDMPATAQSLYFHLSMRADDDGFVSSPRKIMKICNSSDDDYKLLMAKQFLIPFDSGICVIKHWRIHNYIQSDRYQPTMYQDEKAQIQHEDGQYYPIGECIQPVSIPDTQVRLGKVSLGKDSGESTRADGEHNGRPVNVATLTALIAEYGQGTVDDYLQRISDYCNANGKRYKDHAATCRNWLKRDNVPRLKVAKESGAEDWMIELARRTNEV